MCQHPYTPWWIAGAGHNDIEAKYDSVFEFHSQDQCSFFAPYINRINKFVKDLEAEQYPKGNGDTGDVPQMNRSKSSSGGKL